MTTRSRQLVVSLIVACAMFMQNLDSTIIATALPAIGESLGENPLRLNVAITRISLNTLAIQARGFYEKQVMRPPRRSIVTRPASPVI